MVVLVAAKELSNRVALDRMRNNDAGLALGLGRFLQGGDDLLHEEFDRD